jgi:two-component system chemotaxis response regulator CheB
MDPRSVERVVVIGASAGGVEALKLFVRDLPAEFPAPVVIVLHLPPETPSVLAPILARSASVTVKTAVDGETLQAGVVYVAPPDRHVLVHEDGTIATSRGPRENRHRPAVDPLFRSAALAFGNGAIGVILSGALDDGTAGLLAIKRVGGLTLVQDPSDALFSGMPESALAHVEVDACLPLESLPSTVIGMVNTPPPPASVSEEVLATLRIETQIATLDPRIAAQDDRPGSPSPYSCPDCGGVLWEIHDGHMTRFRCRTGHAFGPESMMAAQGSVLEEALWTAMKTLEESARLSLRLAQGEDRRGNEWLAARFREKERDARERSEVIRKFLVGGSSEILSGAGTPAPDVEDQR